MRTKLTASCPNRSTPFSAELSESEIEETAKDCLTPVLSLALLTGGNKERIGGSLKRIASRSLERRDQAALCTPSAGFYPIDVREVFVVVVRQVL